MIIAITQDGFVKKTPKSEFKAQKIGSNGVFRSFYADGIKTIREASLEDTLLLFTEQGKCCRMEVMDVPSTKISEKGMSLKERFNIVNDNFCAILSVKSLFNSEGIVDFDVLIMTKKGKVVKHKLSDYKNRRIIQAITLNENDCVVDVALLKGSQFLFNSCNTGYGKMFESDDIPITSLSSKGKGVICFGRLINNINVELCGLDISQSALWGIVEDFGRNSYERLKLPSNVSFILVTKNGYIRRIETFYGYGRATHGKKLVNIKDDDAVLFNAFITNTDNILLITSKGNVARIDLSKIEKLKFYKKGIELLDGEIIVACCKISPSKEIVLNIEKFDTYKQETKKSQSLLSDIFVDKEEIKTDFKSDSDSVVEMLKILFAKDVWKKDELESICKNKGLILGAILEEINDYSYSKIYDGVVEDDGDNIYVTLDYKEDLL